HPWRVDLVDRGLSFWFGGAAGISEHIHCICSCYEYWFCSIEGYGLGGFGFRYLAYINLCVEGCIVEENERGCGWMRTVAAVRLG
nr:hypothetical protein [Tanacetum cinerariifolium]